MERHARSTREYLAIPGVLSAVLLLLAVTGCSSPSVPSSTTDQKAGDAPVASTAKAPEEKGRQEPSAIKNTGAKPVAFPGAEGWGQNALGGRNEKTAVLFVTSLEDSGPGTLREALKTKGPRIVLFKTGGIIDLKSAISFREDYVTVAGQTAPGDGIVIRNFPIRIGASHVIMRGLRIRNGDGPGPKGDLRDSVQIGSTDGTEIRDVIVDRCSFGWSVDETGEFWFGAGHVTVQYCIFSEALWKNMHEKGSHGYAFLIANKLAHHITLHHNLFAHNERRNPWIKDNARVEIVNNVVYNWGTEGTGLWLGKEGPPIFVNVIGNYYKGGVDSGTRRGINLGKPAAPGSQLYIRGNIGPGRTDDKQDEWDAVGVGDFEAKVFRSNQPIADQVSGLKEQSAAAALETVLKSAGALPRDSADKRAVEDTRNGTGKHIDRLDQVGGYPAYAAGTYPADADEDGMPDDWERAHGLNPADKSDATRFSTSGSGYLNIEEYVNSLLP